MAITAERLALELREAEAAHGAFERELGHADPDWPAWYANFIVARLDQPRGIGLDAEDLRILEAALHAYLDDFGHEEADVLRQAKATLAKVRAT
jgi:hypothetical protein